MLKHLAAAALLALALPGVALAGNPDVKEARQEMKAAKRYHKDVDKLVRKWEKAARKGREDKLAKRDAELDELYRTELARLRELGVPTKKVEPKPINPDHPEKVVRLAPENPKMEALRDDLVALRDLGEGPKALERKARLLSDVNESVAKRYERAEQRLLKAKGKA